MTNYTFQQLIDFTRVSSIANVSSGTFVGSNGLIQNSPQSRNLLTFTQEFDNAAWSKARGTVTANTSVAPDGTPTADTLTATATGTYAAAFRGATYPGGTVYTLSVYAKASVGQHLIVYMNETGDVGRANFNLNTGAIGNISAGTTATMTSVGNGWWRCVVTATPTVTASAIVIVGVVDSNTVTTVTSGQSISIWGAQLEQASTASDYTRNVGGLFPARFDYDPVTLAPRGILIEEQRTNVVLTSSFATLAGSAGSQYPSGTGWANFFNTGGTRTYIASAVFAGAQAMDVAGVSAARNFIGFGFTAASSTTYTVSFYVEAVTGATGIVAYAEGTLGTGGTSNNVTAPTAPGRYSYTFTTGTSAGTVNLRFGIGAAGNESGSIRISNVQCEAGAFATSYIPTVASQVTRTADQASIVAPMFAPWYNQSEGTMVVEASSPATASIVTMPALITDTAAMANAIRLERITGNVARGLVASGGVNSGSSTPSWPVNTIGKLAVAYGASGNGAAFNGTTLTMTGNTPPIAPLLLSIGSVAGAGNFINGHIRRVTYYPTRLSDLQLQALTA